jgi:hypothetical protein
MRPLLLDKKSGFRSTMPFTIYDPRGIVFYSSDFTHHIADGQPLNFNVIAGSFNYDGNFIKLESPVPTKNISVPLKERNMNMQRYEIIFGANPNKCTIFYDEGYILFDTSFENAPLYIKYTIYFHELSHHWYITESKADLYATKKLLELGFNPSQIQMGFLQTLSDKSIDRKMNIVYSLTTNEG